MWNIVDVNPYSPEKVEEFLNSIKSLKPGDVASLSVQSMPPPSVNTIATLLIYTNETLPKKI